MQARTRQILFGALVLIAVASWGARLPGVLAAGPALPTLFSLDPQTVTTGSPATAVRLFGTFTSGDEVTLNGVALATTFVSGEELRATVPAAQLAVPTAHELRVRNANGSSAPQQLFVSSPRVGLLVTAADVPVSEEPISMATGDFNGDRRPDMVFAGGTALHLAFGNATGGLGAPVPVALGNTPTQVAVADVNLDGKDDLLAAQGAAGVLSVLLNGGASNFAASTHLSTGHTDAPAIAVGDLDQNGTLDLLVANKVEGTIGVFLGVGDGTYTALPTFTSQAQPVTPVVGDFNADGKLDFLDLSALSGALALHLGNGDGTFGDATNIPLAAGTSSRLYSGDVNGDKHLDLVLPRTPGGFFATPRIEVLLGQGNGTFAAPSPQTQPQIPLLTSMTLTDLDGDGDQDLIGLGASFTTYFLRGNRTGNFTFWTERNLPYDLRQLASVDLGKDGRADFVIGGLNTGVFPAQPTLTVLTQTDPGAPPRIVFPDATFTETDGASTSVRMRVLLQDANGQSATSTVPIPMTLAFADGTAVVNEDYRPSPATVFTIPANATEGEIDFRVVGGLQFEPPETFTIRINTADGAVIQDGEATVTIVDNDPPPPQADISTTFTIDDDLGPGEPVTGTVTVRNDGPAPAQNPFAAVQVDFFDLAKLSNIQITNSTFLVSNVIGGLIRGQDLSLAPNEEKSLTFTATTTAAARTPEDRAASNNDPNQLLPLNYSLNQASAPGRKGVAFERHGDGNVNDLLLYDPDANVFRIVNDSDSPTTQTENIDLNTSFPNYAVASLDVCRLGGAGPSAVLALAREPGAPGEEGLVVTRDLAPGANPSFETVIRRAESPILGTVCGEFFTNGVDDVLAFGPNEVIVARNLGPGMWGLQAPISTYPVTSARGMVGGDFNGDGTNDILVLGEDPEFFIDFRVGGGTVLLPLSGDGNGGFTPQRLIDLSRFGGIADIVGGTGRDPVANVERPIDFNADGFPDVAVACTRCGDGGTYGVVPLRNLGATDPFAFDVQAPITVGRPGRTGGLMKMVVLPLGAGTLTASFEGLRAELENRTRAGANTIALTLKRENDRISGSGPSAIIPMNAHNDTEADTLVTDLRGRILFGVTSASLTLDPNPANNGDLRTVIIRPGQPDEFTLNPPTSLRWTPGKVGRLDNLAANPGEKSLDDARVYARDQRGNTVDMSVLSTDDRKVFFLWGLVPRLFRELDAQVALYAETAGGTGTSSVPPIIEAGGLPPEVRITNRSAVEGDSGSFRATINVSLVGPPGSPNEGQPTTSDKRVTLDVTASDGTAVAGSDYQFTPQTVVIEPGQTSATFEVDVVGDTTAEGEEAFTLNIVATNATAPSSVTFNIADNDLPELSIRDAQVVENIDTPSGPLVESTLVLSRASNNPVSVRVRTVAGTATEGEDYVKADLVVVIPAGETTALVSTFVKNDAVDEADETYFIQLSEVSGAVLGDAVGQVTIVDDDEPVDVEPPVIEPHANVTELATSPAGAAVVYTPPAISDNKPGVSVVCVPPSGSSFPIGTTTVTCTATDAAGNTARSTFTVTVEEPPDAEPPVIGPHANVTELATSPAGATVVYTPPPVSDNKPGVSVVCVPPSGSPFPIGTTTVTCTATDAAGNTARSTFTVTVEEPPDTEAPTIEPHANVTELATSPAGAAVVYTPPQVSDNKPGASVVCVPPPGSFFPVGTTTVTCTATDAAGNIARSTFMVTVNVGAPRIATRAVGQGVNPSGTRYVDLSIRNTGTGNAFNVNVSSIVGRTRAADGSVRVVPISNFKPFGIGELRIGQTSVTRVEFITPKEPSVSITTQGSLTDARGAPVKQFSTSSSVRIPTTP